MKAKDDEQHYLMLHIVTFEDTSWLRKEYEITIYSCPIAERLISLMMDDSVIKST